MRNRVERLRLYLLGSAGFLVLVIAGFIGSARYLRRHYLANLPAKLGVNIVRETNGYSYCQTIQGRTAYCIHAAKAIEHTDGKIALHDVAVTLYGRKGDRADRIYGDEFEYDQNQGIVRATGLVHIDMQAANRSANAKVMHVTTSALVYLQKLGVAATSAPIDFESAGIAGHAVGADYASDSGMLMLHSAVDMAGTASGQAFAMTAASAQYDDRNQQVLLTHATYKSQGGTALADQSTVYRRPDGTISRVEAEGNVVLEDKGATVAAQRADIALTAASQPQTAVLSGGVTYSADAPLRQVRGHADEATIVFDSAAKPQPQHAVFTGSVHLAEQVRANAAANQPWDTRELTASRLVAEMVVGKAGASQLSDADATGNPRLTIVNRAAGAAGKGAGTLDISADELKGHMAPATGVKQPPQLETLAGRGRTVLHQLTPDGVEQTSAGDSLDARFRPRTAGAPGSNASAAANGSFQLADALSTAVQQGHVTLTRRTPPKAPKDGSKAGAGGDAERATAQRAVYDGDTDRMTLTGSVQVVDSGSEFWANQVTVDRKTGNAQAAGAVRMNYVQQDTATGQTPAQGGARQAEPTHVLADRADLDHEAGSASFYGKPVRLWQGGNQVLAPVIEFSKAQKRLIAHGESQTGWQAGAQPAQVHTILTAAESKAGGGAAPGAVQAGTTAAGCAAATPAAGGRTAAGTQRAPGSIEIASGGLVYSGILRQADFTGGFRADTADGTIRGNEGTVYLAETHPSGSGPVAAGAGPDLAGNVDRVIAVGRVELDKPGLKATGARLVYTASDRTALLTGEPDAPVKAVDAQGTTTGASMRFRSSCDTRGSGSVEVLGGTGQNAHTDAEINNDSRKEKGKR